MDFNIKNTFITELPGDQETENTPRQVDEACYSFVNPTKTDFPELVHYSQEVAQFLGLSESDCQSEWFLKIFTGNEIIEN